LLFKPPGSVLNFVGESEIHGSRAFQWVKELRRKLVLYNAIEGRPTAPLSPRMRELLQRTFRRDSEVLAEILGRDLSHWYDEASS
jgi:hypothetical protein